MKVGSMTAKQAGAGPDETRATDDGPVGVGRSSAVRARAVFVGFSVNELRVSTGSMSGSDSESCPLSIS